MTIEECVESCGELLETVFVGDGAAVHMEYIKEQLGEQAFFAPANSLEQRASSVACAAYEKYKNGEASSYTEVNPVYLKKSQAERELEERNKKQ